MKKPADKTAKKQRVIGKPFPKGVSGNPNGRPKGTISITAAIKKRLQEIPEGQKKTYLELLLTRILSKAIKDGDTNMIKQIWAYIDGMPKQTIIGDPDNPISLLFTDADEFLKKKKK